MVHGSVGQPLRVAFADDEDRVVSADSEILCVAAEKRPLDEAILRDQLGRLGETPFKLTDIEVHLDGAVLIPSSELNRLRRDLAARLEALWTQPPTWTLLPYERESTKVSEVFVNKAARTTAIIPVIRELTQLAPALAFAPPAIYVELEDPKRLKDAVAQVRAAEAAGGHKVEIWAVGPRIYKQGEEWIVKQLRESGADGFLVRNHEHLRAFAGSRLRGDFSLNVANPLTAEWFMQQHQLEGLTASYDLNADQLAGLLRNAPADWFEVTLHQHMPMFHMEHCVFCAFLSAGKDYRDCGRPCDKHRVTLRDRVGAAHILKADAGCRNTLYNSRAQTGAEFAHDLLKLGVSRFRVEFVDEDPATVTRTLDRYQALLAGKLSGSELWQELKVLNQLGVTRGTLMAKG
jgi:putative protease